MRVVRRLSLNMKSRIADGKYRGMRCVLLRKHVTNSVAYCVEWAWSSVTSLDRDVRLSSPINTSRALKNKKLSRC